MAKTVDRQVFFDAVKAEFGDINIITRKHITEVCEKHNIKFPNWFTNDSSRSP